MASVEDGTGDWILSHPKFTSWNKSEYSSLLWLHGKPGSGKSTLLKRAVAMLSSSNVDHMSHDRDTVVAAFFYSARGKKTEMSHTLMLRSLLYQILLGNSALFSCFRAKFTQISKTGAGTDWSDEDLKSVFVALRVARAKVKIYLVVDAMDESEKGGRPRVLQFLSELCSSRSSCVFKGLIASRPYSDISKYLSRFDSIELQAENAKDIETFIDKGLERLSANIAISKEQEKMVRDHLVRENEGVFLWVSIILKELESLVSTGLSNRSLKELLQSLQSEIVELYKRIVDRIKAEPSKILNAKKMLNWAAFAERPLRLDEFGDAFIIPSDDQLFVPEADFISDRRITSFGPQIAHYCDALLEASLHHINTLLRRAYY